MGGCVDPFEGLRRCTSNRLRFIEVGVSQYRLNSARLHVQLPTDWNIYAALLQTSGQPTLSSGIYIDGPLRSV